MPRSRVFYRFLISNFIVLVLPVLLLFLIVYQSFVVVLGRETSRLYESFLAQGIIEVENRLANYAQISFQIQANADLRRENIAATVTDAREAVQTLKRYAAIAPGLLEILFYYYGDSAIYTSEGVYNPEILSERVYQFENLEKGRFLERIKSSKNFDVIAAQDVTVLSQTKDRILIFILPLPYNDPEKKAAVAFFVAESVFMAPFGGFAEGNGTSVLTLDKEGNVIAGLFEEDTREAVLTAAPGFSVGTRMMTIRGAKHIVVGKRSEITGLTFFSVIPRRTYDEPFSAIWSRLLIALLLIVLLGSLAVYLISYANYNPLRLLKAYADQRAGGTGEQDEIASVKLAVEHLYATSRIIEKRLEDNQSAIRNALLWAVVNGRLSGEREFAGKAGDFDLPATAAQYAVGVFNLGDSALSGDQPLVERVERLLSPYFPVLGGKGDVKGNFPTFVFFLKEGDFDMLDGLLLEVWERLAAEGYPLRSIGVGDPRPRLAEVPDSYDEAVRAADYRLTRCDAKVIFFAAIADKPDGVQYPKELTEKFQNSLMQMDMEKATANLDELTGFMAESGMPLFLVRVVCFDIITTMIKTIETLDRSGEGWRTEYRDIERLMEFDTVDDLAAAVRNLLQEAFTRIRRSRTVRSDERVESIKAYMRDNFRDKNFSTCMMADHFKVSISSLSHYFKAKTGSNISDYVNELRIEEAKRILRETELPVQEIVAKLGYLSVSSFIRKFRQETGQTPGAYRETKSLRA